MNHNRFDCEAYIAVIWHCPLTSKRQWLCCFPPKRLESCGMWNYYVDHESQSIVRLIWELKKSTSSVRNECACNRVVWTRRLGSSWWSWCSNVTLESTCRSLFYALAASGASVNYSVASLHGALVWWIAILCCVQSTSSTCPSNYFAATTSSCVHAPVTNIDTRPMSRSTLLPSELSHWNSSRPIESIALRKLPARHVTFTNWLQLIGVRDHIFQGAEPFGPRKTPIARKKSRFLLGILTH